MDLKKISVETKPNGYALDVDGNGFLYFSASDLLEGFMYHVGLGMDGACSSEIIHDMLVTAMNWKENKDAVMEIKRLTAELETASRRLTAASQHEEELTQRIAVMVASLKETVKSERPTVATLTAAIKSIAKSAGRRSRKTKDEEEDGE